MDLDETMRKHAERRRAFLAKSSSAMAMPAVAILLQAGVKPAFAAGYATSGPVDPTGQPTIPTNAPTLTFGPGTTTTFLPGTTTTILSGTTTTFLSGTTTFLPGTTTIFQPGTTTIFQPNTTTLVFTP